MAQILITLQFSPDESFTFFLSPILPLFIFIKLLLYATFKSVHISVCLCVCWDLKIINLFLLDMSQKNNAKCSTSNVFYCKIFDMQTNKIPFNF